VTLSWTLPKEEDLCGASLEQRVEYWQEGDNAKHHSVTVPSDRNYLTIRVSGGLYFWNLTLSVSNLFVDFPEDTTQMFIACNERSPSAPKPLSPDSVASRSGLSFIITYADPGEFCSGSGFNPVEGGFIVELSSVDKDAGVFSKNYSIPISSLPSFDNRLTIPVDNTDEIPYGYYNWNAITVNKAGRGARSKESGYFLLCDQPRKVPLDSPVNGAETNSHIVFSWQYSTSFIGFSCQGKANSLKWLTLYFDDLEDMKKNGVQIPQTSLMRWRAEDPPHSFNASEILAGKLVLGHTYAWCLTLSISDTEVSTSEVRRFTVSMMDCAMMDCKNGGKCVEEGLSAVCVCQGGYTGDDCSQEPGANLYIILGTTIPGFVVAVAIIITIVGCVIKRRKKNSRTKVLLKAPGGDLRFSHVKPALISVSGKMRSAATEHIISDANGDDFAWSMAIVAATPSTSIENVVKALLYAHRSNKSDVELLKHMISVEVDNCKSDKVIFRANTAATLTFKHFSKMVGMTYLFQTFGKLLQDVIQKDIDDAATEAQVKKDKKLVDLMVMQDTYEVDPVKLAEMGHDDEDDLLSVNEIQLTLLVQRFLKHIFQSVSAMPSDLREVISHLSSEVQKKFPSATQRAMSAFLFLRFFNCAIAIPEAYGLLKEPPNQRIRRSLVLCTKILTTLASGAHFGDKEVFMTQFNDLIDKNQKALNSFYTKVAEYDAAEPDAQGKTKEDLTVPSKLLDDSLGVLAEASQSLDESTVKPSDEDE